MSKFYSNPPKEVLAAFREKRGTGLTSDWLYHQNKVRKAQKWARHQMYQQYLTSDAWTVKRTAVLMRDNGNCVFCGDKAQAVHHLSYDRIFNESLYDLASVCKGCHEAIHYKG